MKLTILAIPICLLIFSALAKDSCFNVIERFIKNADQDFVEYSVRVNKVNQQLIKLVYKYPHKLKLKKIGKSFGEPVYVIEQKKKSTAKAMKLLVTSGVHGDEPMGVLASMKMLQDFIENEELYSNVQFTFIPMMNPGGLKKGTRFTLSGSDFNRSFSPDDKYFSHSKMYRKYFSKHHFDMVADLHGCVSREKFFIISADNDGGLAAAALKKMPQKLLVSSDDNTYPAWLEAMGDPKKYRLTAAGLGESNNAGTVKGFLFNSGTQYSYTLEYPRKMAGKKSLPELFKMLKNLVLEGQKSFNRL